MSDTTCKEAGRRGGLATSAKYGREHFAALAGLAPPKPPTFYRRIAPLGGAATRAKLGRPHYQEIGRKGRETLLARRGKAFYEEIGRKGGLAAAERKRATQARP